MIYLFLKPIVKTALFVFFKKIVVTGKENIPEKGPLIIVANHPSTLMDPLIITSICKQKIGYLGNASLFSNSVLNKAWGYFNVIPIYRKKDALPGEKPDNKKAFVKCYEYLEKANTILIFPEGNSYYELKLREIKTGTARIALGFEELNNFKGNLKILPITLDYSDAIQFRSVISVTVNPPFSVENFKEIYLKNEFEGVAALTEAIRKELAKNIPHTVDKEQQEFLIKIHKFFAAYHEPKADFLNPKESLALRNQLSKAIKAIGEKNPTLYDDTQNKIYAYFDMLKKDSLTPGFFASEFLKRNREWVCFSYLLKFVFLLPIYIFGLLINYLPYILPSKVFKILKIDIEYKTSVELIIGIIVFPVFYGLEIWLFRSLVSKELWPSGLLLLAFLASGYIAMYYWTEIKRFSRVINYYFFVKQERKTQLLELKKEIWHNIEEARKSLDDQNK